MLFNLIWPPRHANQAEDRDGDDAEIYRDQRSETIIWDVTTNIKHKHKRKGKNILRFSSASTTTQVAGSFPYKRHAAKYEE